MSWTVVEVRQSSILFPESGSELPNRGCPRTRFRFPAIRYCSIPYVMFKWHFRGFKIIKNLSIWIITRLINAGINRRTVCWDAKPLRPQIKESLEQKQCLLLSTIGVN